MVLASHSSLTCFSSALTCWVCQQVLQPPLFSSFGCGCSRPALAWHGYNLGCSHWERAVWQRARRSLVGGFPPARELLLASALAHGPCLSCTVGLPVPSLALRSPADLSSQLGFRPSPSPQPCLAIRAIGCPGHPPDLLCSSCFGTMGQGSCPRPPPLHSGLTFPCRAGLQPLLPDRPENVERERITPQVQDQMLEASFASQKIHPPRN